MRRFRWRGDSDARRGWPEHIPNGDERNLDRAIAGFTRAIERDPNDVYAYRMRGAAYGEKGDHDHAIADCTRAIEIDPDLAAAAAPVAGRTTPAAPHIAGRATSTSTA